MTPTQAIQYLDQAVAKIVTDRQTHANLIEALQALRKIVSESETQKAP